MLRLIKSSNAEAPTPESATRAVHTEVGVALASLAPLVRGWVHRFAGPRGEVDDLTQLVLIELASALTRFRGESSLETYARRITIRTVRHAFRAKRGSLERADLHLVENASTQRNPESIAIDRDTLRRFYAHLDTLSEKRRTAFVLCSIEKLSHEEAAHIEGISIETLRARLKHARADLAILLENDPQLRSEDHGRTP